jgi:hypothetical protein
MADDSNAIKKAGSAQQKDNGEPNHKSKKRPLLITDDTAAPCFATVTRLANGTLLRTLQPYLFTFTSFAKGRWVGRTVLDVYSDEFGAYPASYYR